jgi:ElaB/YqjD/DUF883 family membrane-anchored ribosome-binding protein
MVSNPVNRLERAWSRTVPATGEIATTWKEKMEDWEQEVKDFIVERPMVAVTAAAMVGLVVGWMVKRK